MADGSANGCDMRLPYAAARSEGENACVIGPRDEILVEITHGDQREQWQLAAMIAAMLNDHDDNHGCSDTARRARAQHFLLLVRENRVVSDRPMEILQDAIGEAGVKFARDEITELAGRGLPF